jgi:hypothetical protein
MNKRTMLPQRTMIAFDEKKGEWLFTTNIDSHIDKISDEIEFNKVRYVRDKDGNKIKMTAIITNLQYLGIIPFSSYSTNLESSVINAYKTMLDTYY